MVYSTDNELVTVFFLVNQQTSLGGPHCHVEVGVLCLKSYEWIWRLRQPPYGPMEIVWEGTRLTANPPVILPRSHFLSEDTAGSIGPLFCPKLFQISSERMRKNFSVKNPMVKIPWCQVLTLKASESPFWWHETVWNAMAVRNRYSSLAGSIRTAWGLCISGPAIEELTNDASRVVKLSWYKVGL